jgi:hypothetical protein
MPTFGDTTAGGDTFPTTNDRAILSKFSPASSGTVTQINVRFHSTSAAGDTFKGLIYAADGAGGIPGTRLGIGDATSVPAGGGDLASTGLSVAVTGSVDYWIGAVINSSNSVFETDASGGLSRMEACTYASPAATWTESGTSAAQVNAYATYLSGPTITAQPQNATAYEGQTANFTISATGTGTLSYQWKDDGSNVGTDSNSYTTAALTFSDNGAQITCDVTDDVDTTASSAATLTVLIAARSAWLRA